MRKKKAVSDPGNPAYPMIGKPSIDRREFIVLFGFGAASMTVLTACGSSIPEAGAVSKPPVSAEPEVDKNGDDDCDGVAYKNDKCPNEPETYNGIADEDGCPDRPPGVVLKTSGVAIRPQSILFRNKKAKMLLASQAVIGMVVEALKANPEVESLLIIGHADKREGKPAARKRISTRRAEYVLDQLVKKGVDKKRLRSIGLSDACPMAIGNTPESREKNRRVEFRVLTLDGKPKDVEIGCEEAVRRKLIPEGVFE